MTDRQPIIVGTRKRRAVSNEGNGWHSQSIYLSDADRCYPLWSTTLPGPNGEIRDIEAIIRGVIDECWRRWPGMDSVPMEEWISFLNVKALEQIEKYDPEKRNGTGSAEGYLYDRLRWRMRDEWRDICAGRRGRDVLTVDHPEGAGTLELLHVDADVEDGWAVDRGGLYAQGDRSDPRRVGNLGGSESPGVARDVARSVEGSGGRRRGRAEGEVRARAFQDCECGVRLYAQPPNGLPGWHLPDFCTCGRALV